MDKITMKGEEIGGQVVYASYPKCEEEEVIIDQGTYISTYEGRYGTLHKFQLPDGGMKVLPKAGDLDKKMENIFAGDVVSVQFLGKIILEDGDYKGKPCNKFRIVRHGKAESLRNPAETATKSELSDNDLDELE